MIHAHVNKCKALWDMQFNGYESEATSWSKVNGYESEATSWSKVNGYESEATSPKWLPVPVHCG